MNKGIRLLAVQLFAERNPLRIAGEIGNTDFRKGICLDLEDRCAATPSSAAMAYNYAKKKFAEQHPELVEGLGRAPEKNNGGRRRTVSPVVQLANNLEFVENFYSPVPDIYDGTVNRDA